MENFMSALNERIKEIRLDAGLNQEVFGKRIGLAKSSVSWVEKGRQAISENIIKNILNEFCINETWLKDGTGDKYNEELKNQKEFINNEFQFMSDKLRENQRTFFEKLSLVSDDERLEMISILEELYVILNKPKLKAYDYFEYFETISGMLFEISRFVDYLGTEKISKELINKYIGCVKKDLIQISELFIHDDVSDPESENVIEDNTSFLCDKEIELLMIFDQIPEDKKDLAINILKPLADQNAAVNENFIIPEKYKRVKRPSYHKKGTSYSSTGTTNKTATRINA